MNGFRPSPKTPRALIDYNYIFSMLGEQVLICVPRGAYQIARDFIIGSGFYVGSYYTDVNDAGYYTPTVEQFDHIDSILSEFLAAEVYDVDCFQNLILAINCLCQAIYNTNTGGGTGGSGVYPQVASDFTDNGTDFPDGYSDVSEYHSGKCDLAQYLINLWVGDFDRLKTINTSVAGAGALAGLLSLVALTPIPGTQLFLIAAAILGLVASSVAAFTNALDELSTRIQAMDICLLYDADTAEEAIENVQQWIADGSYTIQTLTVELGQYFITTDAVNKLFNPKDDSLNYDELPTGDCSECGAFGECWAEFTTPGSNDGVIVDEGSLPGDGWFYDVQFEVSASPPCTQTLYRMNFAIPASCVFQVKTVSVVSGSWTKFCCFAGCSPPNSGTDVWGYFTPEGGSATAADDPTDFQDINIETLTVYSAQAVTLRFEVFPPE